MWDRFNCNICRVANTKIMSMVSLQILQMLNTFRMNNFHVTMHTWYAFTVRIKQMGILSKDFWPLTNTPDYLYYLTFEQYIVIVWIIAIFCPPFLSSLLYSRYSKHGTHQHHPGFPPNPAPHSRRVPVLGQGAPHMDFHLWPLPGRGHELLRHLPGRRYQLQDGDNGGQCVLLRDASESETGQDLPGVHQGCLQG